MKDRIEYSLVSCLNSDATSEFCIGIDDIRIRFLCSEKVFLLNTSSYQYSESKISLPGNASQSGEIVLFRDRILVLNDGDMPKNIGLNVSVNAQIWTKSELNMGLQRWSDNRHVQCAILRSFQSQSADINEIPGYYAPSEISDIHVLDLNNQLWGSAETGRYKSIDQFYTQLTDELVLIIVFNTGSCWNRDTLPPEGLKEHLMSFFKDYLSRIQIISTEGMPEAELPPLGFYPSKREEKEIDSEGNTVVEDTSSTSSSEWGW